MASVNTVALRLSLSGSATKKKFSAMLAKSIYEDIDLMSNHHPGIFNVANRLAYFITPLLEAGQTSLLNIILSQAMTEWHAHYLEYGCRIAFSAYCNSILKDLPLIFNYSVSGRCGTKPFLMTSWDCTSQSLSTWLTENMISQCSITYNPVSMVLSQRESSFLLASRVFNRHELTFWGVKSELSNIPLMSKAESCQQS